MMPTEEFGQIQQIVYLYTHVVDDRLFSRFGEVFTPDAEFDFTAVGGEVIQGCDRIAAQCKAWLEIEVIHLASNIAASLLDDSTAEVSSRSLVLLHDGSVSNAIYQDIMRRTADGWRIARRSVAVRGEVRR